MKVPAPKPIGYPTKLEKLVDHVKAARLDRELLQREVAAALGITTSAVERWEKQRSGIKPWNIPAVTQFLGYCLVEQHPENGWKQTLLNYRKQLGWNLVKMARLLKTDVRNLIKIERGEKLTKKTEERIQKSFVIMLAKRY